MTATRYASIALSGRVVACGNIIFKPSETTPHNLIGRCRGKSLLICIGFHYFQLVSVVSPKTVVYVTMDWLPFKCMGFRILHCLLLCVSDRRGQPTIRDVDFGDGGQKSRRSSGLRFQFNHIYFLSRLWILAKVLI